MIAIAYHSVIRSNNFFVVNRCVFAYLDEWEDSVKGRDSFDKSQKSMMLLSVETRQGLRLTGKMRSCASCNM